MTCKQDTQRGGTSHTARGGKIEPRKLAQIKIFSYLCSVKTRDLTSEGDTQNTPNYPSRIYKTLLYRCALSRDTAHFLYFYAIFVIIIINSLVIREIIIIFAAQK